MRDFFRPARRVGGGNGTKFSLLAQNGPKSGFWGVLGEFCTGWACQGRVRGEFCTGTSPGSGTKFSLLAQNGPKSGFWGVLGEFCTGIAGAQLAWGEFWPIAPPHSVDGGREAGITKPPGTRPGGGGAGDGNRTRL